MTMHHEVEAQHDKYLSDVIELNSIINGKILSVEHAVMLLQYAHNQMIIHCKCYLKKLTS
jgi:hypothetical protein